MLNVNERLRVLAILDSHTSHPAIEKIYDQTVKQLLRLGFTDDWIEAKIAELSTPDRQSLFNELRPPDGVPFVDWAEETLGSEIAKEIKAIAVLGRL